MEIRHEFKRLPKRAKENFSKAFSELFDDLKDAFYEAFVQIPKDIKRFFNNVWAYKVLLWEDRDYDHSYILRMLQFKIKKTKEHIADHKLHTNWKRDVKNMQKAEDTLESILSYTHDNELYKAHDEKWGKTQSVFIDIPGSECSQWRTVRLKARTPEEQKQERKEYSALIRKSIKLEDRVWKSLWANLDKNLRNWWD